MAGIFGDCVVNTESDVEQKILYKMLTLPIPQGLGFSDSDFITKPNIRKFQIEKGKSKKIYFPDYVILVNGLPILIIEAKAPGEDIYEACREARLYATEVNAPYPSGVNPCKYVIVTNGKRILLTNWDSEIPITDFPIEDAHPMNPQFSKLCDYTSKPLILKQSEHILQLIKKDAKYIKPLGMLGGKAVSSQSVGENSFGANLSLEYSYLFNPETREERKNVVRNAYVASKRRQTHIGTIDKLIKAAIPPTSRDARILQDTNNPNEIIEEISVHKKIKNQLLLLIGAVGSGKSTFVDFLREIALPKDLLLSTEWVNINLNAAPMAREHIYNWLLDKIIEQIKFQHSNIDFDTLEILKKVYKDSLTKLEKGRGALYPKDSEKYADLMYEEIKGLQENKIETLKALIKFLFVTNNKLLIVVLDNCDKLERNDQLLMFEVATWLKNDYVCCVFLPLRDSTYDQYCDLPPLDTVIKDLVFRIDPPLLDRVIYERLNFARREISSNQTEFHYTLNNSTRVVCNRNEVAIYLSCIINSLFQDNFVRRIITGLSGSNIRTGLEIVLEFCKSGHISDNEIFKIRGSNGDYRLPNYIITGILLKRKRLYYNDEHSFLLNLFHSDRDELLPDPFSRIYILKWLYERRREYGPNKTKGYHRVSDLLRDLQTLGHSNITVNRQLERLCKEGCVETESLQANFSDNDLITIAPPGYIHLELLKNITYLSSVAEDTYFRQIEVATKIRDNMIGIGAFNTHTIESALSTSKLLIDYMYKYHNDFFSAPEQVVAMDQTEPHNIILDSKNYIDKLFEINPDVGKRERLISENPPGTHIRARVASIQSYGLFVEFGLDGEGFIHKSDFISFPQELISCFQEGDWVEVEIIEYSKEHGRFRLRLLDVVNNIN